MSKLIYEWHWFKLGIEIQYLIISVHETWIPAFEKIMVYCVLKWLMGPFTLHLSTLIFKMNKTQRIAMFVHTCFISQENPWQFYTGVPILQQQNDRTQWVPTDEVRAQRYDEVMDAWAGMLHGQDNQLALPAVVVSILVRTVFTALKDDTERYISPKKNPWGINCKI